MKTPTGKYVEVIYLFQEIQPGFKISHNVDFGFLINTYSYKYLTNVPYHYAQVSSTHGIGHSFLFIYVLDRRPCLIHITFDSSILHLSSPFFICLILITFVSSILQLSHPFFIHITFVSSIFHLSHPDNISPVQFMLNL